MSYVSNLRILDYFVVIHILLITTRFATLELIQMEIACIVGSYARAAYVFINHVSVLHLARRCYTCNPGATRVLIINITAL